MDIRRIRDIERAREIVKILKNHVECDRDNLMKELKEIEDRYKLIFY